MKKVLSWDRHCPAAVRVNDMEFEGGEITIKLKGKEEKSYLLERITSSTGVEHLVAVGLQPSALKAGTWICRLDTKDGSSQKNFSLKVT